MQTYPLQWPAGWPRTAPHARRASPFKVGAEKARRELLNELKLLGASNIVVSSNVETRRDGMPYADAARRQQRDPGIAVYFTLKGKPMSMARDRYMRVEDNLRSIGLAVSALRSIQRHGGATMMERAFAGFTAIAASKSHWDILGIQPTRDGIQIDQAFRAKAKRAHPDLGGSDVAMAELNAARERALEESCT